MATQYKLAEEERHTAFLDAQYRAYSAAQSADNVAFGAPNAPASSIHRERYRAQTWAAVADALRKDRV